MATEKNIKKENEIETGHGKILARWNFPEFIKHQRTLGWYIGIGIFLALLTAFAIATQSYLFLIILILLVLIYIMRARRDPLQLIIAITEDGIMIGKDTFYEWGQIKAFWIIYEPPKVKNLYIDFKSGLRPSITISLENQNPLRIRKILTEYITEDINKEEESFTDGLSRILKL